MTSLRRVVRSPWLWTLLAVVLALTSHVLAAIIFLLAYGSLMLAAAWFYRQKWMRTREIHVWRYNLRHRRSAFALIGTLSTLGVLGLVGALATAINAV